MSTLPFRFASVTAEGQERWRQFYADAALRSGDRDLAGIMLQKMETRRLVDRVLAVSSTVVLAGMTAYFYAVLSR
jgi:hypothetical protein